MRRITSFISLGICLVLLICALIFFSWVLIVGAFVGLILFVIAYIRSKFTKKHTHRHNRIIDYKDQ